VLAPLLHSAFSGHAAGAAESTAGVRDGCRHELRAGSGFRLPMLLNDGTLRYALVRGIVAPGQGLTRPVE
jgi:hypothetical protein